MPSPEQGGREENAESPGAAEPYELAARFAAEHLARRTYLRAQDAIFRTPCDLSVFRFLLDRAPHVAVIGEPPPADLDRRRRCLLSAGDANSLSPEVLRLLWQRRIEANRKGPWVERHVRPGKPL